MSANAAVLNLLGAVKNHLGEWQPDTQGSLNLHGRSLLESLERNELRQTGPVMFTANAERKTPTAIDCGGLTDIGNQRQIIVLRRRKWMIKMMQQ